MLSQESFDALAQQIAAANNISLGLASGYAARVGDTPELVSPANSDLVVVRDDGGQEIARIHLPQDIS
jgi:hypothetical protein